MINSVHSPGIILFKILPTIKITEKFIIKRKTTHPKPKYLPTNPITTVIVAAQGMREVKTIDIFFSLSVSIILQPAQAGTLQPKPKIIGIIVFPWTPIKCIILSIKNAALGKYPESCNISMIKKNGMT